MHFAHISPAQCLSNTAPLTEYFLGEGGDEKPYKKHINKDNPLGMGGAIAQSYGALLEEIWSGKCSVTAPRNFKVSHKYRVQSTECIWHELCTSKLGLACECQDSSTTVLCNCQPHFTPPLSDIRQSLCPTIRRLCST